MSDLNQRQAVFLYSEQLENYAYPSSCPFKTDRASKTRKTLASMGMLSGTGKKEMDFAAADRSTLERFHTPRYLDALQRSETGDWDIEALHMGIGGPDTPVFNGMYGYGAMAAGASLMGAKQLLSGEADIVFNPAGGLHHAQPELAAGFCYINDVVFACKHLAENGKKVLYLDIDVHHGDGVQNAFYNQSDVFTISLHESGRTLFPGTGFVQEIGSDEGEGYSVNIPLPLDTYNGAYMRCFNEIVVPLISAYNGDVIVLELGADALSGDPLAHIKLTNEVFRKVLEFLLDLQKPILVTGGGGYHVENTVRAWSLAWSVLVGHHDQAEAINFGLGGVMLESTDWMGGFQDHEIPVTQLQKRSVDPVIESIIKKIKETVFPIHGLKS